MANLTLQLNITGGNVTAMERADLGLRILDRNAQVGSIFLVPRVEQNPENP